MRELPTSAGGGGISASGRLIGVSAADAVGRKIPLTEAASRAF